MPDPSQSSSLKKDLPGFAPDDPTDGRDPLDWKSKYPKEAQRLIWAEAAYLFALLLLIPLAMLVCWLGFPKGWLKLSDVTYEPIRRYTLAWLGGMLGGTVFAIKWLYHIVPHKMWHLDRRLWRLFTPHVSGALAFAMIALISSGMLRVFDRQAVYSHSLIIAVAFLVGHFSDSAIAKLSEIAQTVFGASRATEKHRRKSTERDRVLESPNGGQNNSDLTAVSSSEDQDHVSKV